MRLASTLGVLLALLAAPLLADTLTGIVVGVSDGDTIKVMRAGSIMLVLQGAGVAEARAHLRQEGEVTMPLEQTEAVKTQAREEG